MITRTVVICQGTDSRNSRYLSVGEPLILYVKPSAPAIVHSDGFRGANSGGEPLLGHFASYFRPKSQGENLGLSVNVQIT